MRERTSHPLAGASLAVAAAGLLFGACGDSGSAKGSPASGSPVKEVPAKEVPAEPAAEPIPDLPPVKPLEPAPTPAKEPAPPPAKEPASIEAKPAPEEKPPAKEGDAVYLCAACGNQASAPRTEAAPFCCGIAMKPKP